MATAADLVRRRWDGTYEVDEWGLDTELVELLSPLFALRWGITVTGGEHIPADGPAVLVLNCRFRLSEPFVVSRGVRLATGRFVRVLGAPDRAPVGPALRRLGAALDRPEELAALLRAGHVAAVSLGRVYRNRHHAGPLAAEALAPAVTLDAPVLPVAVLGTEIGRRWRVVIGEPVEAPTGRGPLAVAEIGESARLGVQALLDEAFPPRWFRR